MCFLVVQVPPDLYNHIGYQYSISYNEYTLRWKVPCMLDLHTIGDVVFFVNVKVTRDRLLSGVPINVDS